VLDVVLAVGSQEDVVRLVGEPAGEDEVQGQADRCPELTAVGLDAVLGHHMLKGRSDAVR
jgi:hypothetical protein